MNRHKTDYQLEQAELEALRRAAENNYDELAKTGLSEEEQMRRAFAIGRRQRLAPWAHLTAVLASLPLLIFVLSFVGDAEPNAWTWRAYSFAAFAALSWLTKWLTSYQVPGSDIRMRSAVWQTVRRRLRGKFGDFEA